VVTVRPIGDTAEAILADHGSRSHGVVTRKELLRAGVTQAEIKQRLRVGALIRVHRGVFRVGHQAPSIEARYLAAVRACGDRSLLAGKSAAHLFGLLKAPSSLPEVLTATGRQVKGVAIHRTRELDAKDGTVWRGVPVTTIPRTLVDLAAVLPSDSLARACHEAEVRYRVTPQAVEAVLVRRPNSSGARQLRQFLWGEVPVSLSRLEAAFIAAVREAGLTIPETNRPAGARGVDCRWPDRRVTVELDSYRFHNTRHAWEQDRQREREARARGDEFRRYTWADVSENPGPMLADLRSLLRAGQISLSP
jgi:Transcriptional regulator, AbiEi antitoxin